MARSGSQKPLRQSVTEWGQSQVSFENARTTCCCSRTGCGCCAKSRQGWRTAAGKSHLQLVQEVVQGRDALLQAFALARLSHHLAGAAGVVEGVSGQDLPVVKHTLGEGLTTRVGPQVGSEACGERGGGGSTGSRETQAAGDSGSSYCIVNHLSDSAH